MENLQHLFLNRILKTCSEEHSFNFFFSIYKLESLKTNDLFFEQYPYAHLSQTHHYVCLLLRQRVGLEKPLRTNGIY